MSFVEVAIKVDPEYRDILVAELAQSAYDTFEETETGLNAYCPAEAFTEAELQELHERYAAVFPFSYAWQEIARQNWNEEWEKNFPPLLIEDKVSVRASFHPKPEGVQHDIVINPKMSFGTGHHETTTLMLELQLGVDHAGKRVLDMGCGTGILAIMACRLKAAHVTAADIEDWTAENARENAQLNGCPNIEVYHGDIDMVPASEPFDIILANINRNVLLEHLPVYGGLLRPGGTLLLSGFYEEDVPVLTQAAEDQGLKVQEQRSKNRWTALRLLKID